MPALGADALLMLQQPISGIHAQLFDRVMHLATTSPSQSVGGKQYKSSAVSIHDCCNLLRDQADKENDHGGTKKEYRHIGETAFRHVGV